MKINKEEVKNDFKTTEFLYLFPLYINIPIYMCFRSRGGKSVEGNKAIQLCYDIIIT